MTKLKEVTQFAQGYTALKWWSQEVNKDFSTNFHSKFFYHFGPTLDRSIYLKREKSSNSLDNKCNLFSLKAILKM